MGKNGCFQRVEKRAFDSLKFGVIRKALIFKRLGSVVKNAIFSLLLTKVSGRWPEFCSIVKIILNFNNLFSVFPHESSAGWSFVKLKPKGAWKPSCLDIF